ncbi:Hypothetical predicted protein [Paramuricea clavata]|uniref:Uncharacterized protein n=1 Tax=Paramuricea clavata TaxID=317549 RepID=A0A7D9HH23_PARCT|nr:Hypothetical predicted protein [Paramuricea clavata]
MRESRDNCSLCENVLGDEERVVTGEKGAEGVNRTSFGRGDRIVVCSETVVHKKCRMNYINKKQIDLYKKAKFNKPSLPVKRSARASIGPYDSRTHCLFCGNEIVKASSSGVYSEEYSCVKTDTFVETVLSHCKQRNDDWAFTAQGRIEYFGKDLHVADSLYHRSCDIHFRTNRGIPMQYQVGFTEKIRDA